jgi:predicted glycosyltransferase
MHNLIRILSPYGKIYITSERNLPEWLEKYKLRSKPSNIHHVLAHAKVFIGDSQSMAVEAAMLGVPSIRFNDFAGRISLLEELESKYSLTYSIPTSEPERLYSLIHELIANNKLKEIFRERQQKMIADKIDVTAFWGWLFESYPEHIKMFLENPDKQLQFK